MTPYEILEQSLQKIKKHKVRIDDNMKINIDTLIENINSNKSLVSALVTSLIKKIINPTQDIRLHRTDFENGYSARSLDTNVTAPFFKTNFPKYSNKESAFLTLATREKIPWTLVEGQNLKIRNKKLKQSFFNIFNDIEENNADPIYCLEYILSKLVELSKNDIKIFNFNRNSLEPQSVLNINVIISMLKEHFSLKYSSRLPVIAIYTAYQELMKVLKSYSNKNLMPLNVHTSSDKHSYGDIEIYNEDNKPYEIIEVKHNIAIDRYLIFDIQKKSFNTSISKYYILTTNPQNFISDDEEIFIADLVLKIKQEYNIEIIPNGIINSIKYYLRFIENYKSFVINYSKNLINDAKISTEVKREHIEKWKKILLKNGILKLST